MNHYILAVLQDVITVQDIKEHKFNNASDAVAWLRQNCKPAQANGKLFEINGYDCGVGFIEFESNGMPSIKSLTKECALLRTILQ